MLDKMNMQAAGGTKYTQSHAYSTLLSLNICIAEKRECEQLCELNHNPDRALFCSKLS